MYNMSTVQVCIPLVFPATLDRDGDTETIAHTHVNGTIMIIIHVHNY